MEAVLLFGDDALDDAAFIEGDHIVVEADAVRAELTPIVVNFAVVVDKDCGIDASARKAHGIAERPLRVFGDRHAFGVIAHAEIKIIFPVFFAAIGRKEKMFVRNECGEIDVLRADALGHEPERDVHALQDLAVDGRRVFETHIDDVILLLFLIVGPGDVFAVERLFPHLPGEHIRSRGDVVLLAAILLRAHIKAAVHIELIVKDVRFAVGDTDIGRQNGVAALGAKLPFHHFASAAAKAFCIFS